MSISSDFL